MLISNEYIGTVGYMGGVPSVHEEFCWSWAQMTQYNYEYLLEPGQSIYYDRAKVSYHEWARNYLVNEMRGAWLFQTDTDHCFEPDIVVRMLRAMNALNADVVSGIYLHRAKPYAPVLCQFNGMKPVPITGWSQETRAFTAKGLCAGGGCLMVKREVFKRMKEELKEDPFDVIRPLSEDYSFFKRCERLDIKVYAIPAIESYHLLTKPIGLADYEADVIPSVHGNQAEGYV